MKEGREGKKGRRDGKEQAYGTRTAPSKLKFSRVFSSSE